MAPPAWLVRGAVAGVWLYEGLWCKLMRGQPHEFAVVAAVPRFGQRFGVPFLLALGGAEVAIAAWAMSAWHPLACAAAQTVLLLLLNGNGLAWSRHLIPDPAGMVVRNASFLILVWVAANLPSGP
jgi:hypothetical protein